MPLCFSVKLSSKKKRKNKTNAPVSAVSQPIQSATHQPAPSSTVADSLSLLWTRAVEEYQRNTGTTIPDYFTNLTPEDYVRQVEDNFKDFRENHERLWTVLQSFADIAFTTAGVVGHALKLKVLPPAEAICGAVVVLLQAAKRVSKIYDEIADLLEDLRYLLARAHSYTRGKLEAGMEEMVFNNLVCTLEILGVANKLVAEGRVKMFLRTLVHKDKNITECLDKLERLSSRENHTVNATVLSTVKDVLGVVKDSMEVGREHVDFVKLAIAKIDAAADGVGVISKELQETRNELKEMLIPVEEHTKRQKLERLKPSLSFKSTHNICLNGTRKSIMQGLEQWSVDTSAPNVFWVYGHPGTGKSTIATTFSQFLAEEKLLGASCFFRRQDAHNHSLRAVWRSLAHDLASKTSFLGEHILRKLDKVDLDDASPAKIFQALVADPLRLELAGSKEPLIIVVDAIDEYCWAIEHHQRQAAQRDLISELLTCWEFLSSHIKLFVTSREQLHIAEYFSEDLANRIKLEVGAAAPPASEPANDIRTYFEHHLLNPSLSRYVKITDSDIDALTAVAAGLFIWASTVIAAACDPGCLNLILNQVRQGKFGGDNLSTLGYLYKTILEAECWRCPELFVLMAGTIIVAREPLSCSTLSKLLNMPKSQIMHLTSRLQPILHSEPTLQFVHKSFEDYVTNANNAHHSACPPQFICYTRVAEKQLAEGCFRIMQKGLHFNMGGLPTSHRFNRNFRHLAPDLPKEMIYACHFWYSHLDSHDSIVPFSASALLLLKEYLLFWLEVLSITRTFTCAAPALNLLIRLAQIRPKYREILMRSQDALSLVRTFGDAIDSSYPQIYLSAIPLSPTASITRMQYLPLLKHSCINAFGVRKHWLPSQEIFHGHETWVQTWVQTWVSSFAFSSNGRHVACGSNDRAIRVWDAETHVQIGEPLLGHKEWVSSLAFSLDGQRIVSGSYDRSIRVWDKIRHIQVGKSMEGHEGPINSVAFSLDGRLVVSGSDDCTIRVWDTETHSQLGAPLYGHTALVSSVAFSPDRCQIISGSYDCTVRVWDAESHAQTGEPFYGHEKWVSSVIFSSDGRKVVSGSWDRTIRVWDVEAHTQVSQPLRGHKGTVNSVAFSSNGQLIVSGSDDCTIRLWDAETYTEISRPIQGHEHGVRAVTFCSDGRQIISGSWDSTIRAWDIETYAQIGQSLQGHEGTINSVAFSPEGWEIVSGSDDCTIRTWDVETHIQLGKPFLGHKHMVHSVAFSPNGRKIVSGSWDGTIRVWDAKTHAQLGRPLQGHQRGVQSVSFSRDSQTIASGSDDCKIRLWDTTSHAQLGEPLQGHKGAVNTVAFSSDGRQVVSGSDDCTIRLWDAINHAQIGEYFCGHEHRITSVAFSFDGVRIVSGSWDRTIRVWSTETHAQIGRSIEGHQHWVQSVAFSPDGQKIVSGSWDRTVRLWDAKSHDQLGEALQGHEHNVISVAFSSDGRRIVSGSEDRTVRVWDVESAVLKRTEGLEAPDFEYCASLTTQSTDPHVLPERIYMQDNGWVLSPSGHPLYWIPPYLRGFVQTEHCLAVLGRKPMVTFAFSKFKHGESWTECWEKDTSS